MSNHLLPHKLPDGHGRAQWSVNPATKLVIFVHGFCGSPTGTWPAFPELVGDHPRLADCDFVYYGYDGKFTQAAISAAKFRAFLTELLENPSVFVNNAMPSGGLLRNTPTLRQPGGKYSRIVIAAHSLGAVVSRLALLDIDELHRKKSLRYSWIDQIRLVLFAPAHHGAYTADLVNSYLTNQGWDVSNFLGHAALHKSPLIQDLCADSLTIEYLHKKTEEALLRFDTNYPGHLAAHRVLWAEDDKVVHCLRFFRDEIEEVLPGVDHVRVCKPNHRLARPFQFVLNALEE